jgi:hypothetical protein
MAAEASEAAEAAEAAEAGLSGEVGGDGIRGRGADERVTSRSRDATFWPHAERGECPEKKEKKIKKTDLVKGRRKKMGLVAAHVKKKEKKKL